MADISVIKLPSGSEYNLKDAWARTQIEAITGGSAVVFKGVSSTAITDGGTEKPTVGGTQVSTVSTGDLYFYGGSEFIWGPSGKANPSECWHELGPIPSEFGDLAYADTASGSTSYTPAGSVSSSFSGTGVRLVTDTDVPTSASFSGTSNQSISVSGTTTGSVSSSYTNTNSTKSLTSTGTFTPGGSVSLSGSASTVSPANSGDATYTPAGSVSVSSAGSTSSATTAVTVGEPSATPITNAITYYSVSGETLSLKQIGYSTSSFKTGDASYSFSGTGARLVTDTSVPTSASFSGTSNQSVSVSGTLPTISSSFTGSSMTSTGTFTPGGSVTLSGSKSTVSPASSGTATYTPAGSVSSTLSGTAATISITVSPDSE